jgi:hypothetical protein
MSSAEYMEGRVVPEMPLPELQAMAAIVDVLARHDMETQERIMRYVVDRFGFPVAALYPPRN